MAKVKITGHASGSGVITVTAPNTSTDRTITLPDGTGSLTYTPSITDSGNATAITIDSSERVGFGTTAPAHNVEIVATASGSVNDSLQIRNNATATGTGSRIRFINSTDANSDTNGAAISSVRNVNDNDLVFETENVEAMRIDHTGAVTMPAQPAFQGQNSLTSTLVVNALTTVTFTEIFDQNADFSSTTFTAPVTGKYQLNVHLLLGSVDSAAGYYQLQLHTSNRLYYETIDPDFGQDNAYYSLQAAVLADMDASDTAIVKIVQSGGTQQTDINTTTSKFSGFLAC